MENLFKRKELHLIATPMERLILDLFLEAKKETTVGLGESR